MRSSLNILEKNVLPLLEIKLNFLGCPAHSLVIVQTFQSQISPYAVCFKLPSFEMMQSEFHKVKMHLTIIYCSEFHLTLACK
jgi:hypothetical protein